MKNNKRHADRPGSIQAGMRDGETEQNDAEDNATHLRGGRGSGRRVQHLRLGSQAYVQQQRVRDAEMSARGDQNELISPNDDLCAISIMVTTLWSDSPDSFKTL